MRCSSTYGDNSSIPPLTELADLPDPLDRLAPRTSGFLRSGRTPGVPASEGSVGRSQWKESPIGGLGKRGPLEARVSTLRHARSECGAVALAVLLAVVLGASGC